MDELILKLRELAEHLDETDSLIVYQAIGALQAKIQLTSTMVKESNGIVTWKIKNDIGSGSKPQIPPINIEGQMQ